MVTQIPALVVATAAGMVVTRGGSGTQLDKEIRTQLFGRPKALLIASGALFLFAIVPGLPTLPFLLLSGLAGSAGYVTMRDKPVKKTAAPVSHVAEKKGRTC